MRKMITMTPSKSDIVVTTTDSVPGREVGHILGIVRGSTVRAKHIGSDIVASLRNLVGGEVKEYAQLLAAAREQAYDRMITEARLLGADAIVRSSAVLPSTYVSKQCQAWKSACGR